jgi:hypothetical protein
MKTKKLFLMAAMLLMSVCTYAQSETPLKGDVNGDGKVDVADIVAVIEIMKNNDGTTETKYYWYVGQTDPSTMTEISPIVDDTSSPGWRLIGTTIGTYTLSNPLWDGALNKITTGATKATNYVALPTSTFKMRNSDGGELTALWIIIGTREINGVTYTIYQSVANMKIFNNVIF